MGSQHSKEMVSRTPNIKIKIDRSEEAAAMLAQKATGKAPLTTPSTAQDMSSTKIKQTAERLPSNNTEQKIFKATPRPSEPSEQLQAQITSCADGASLDNLPISTEVIPVPSNVKRFRINVPSSMVPGDIMTIKLNGILTKILITTPTTSTNKKQKEQHHKQDKTTMNKGFDSSPLSQATTMSSTTTTSSSSSSSRSSSKPRTDDPAAQNNADNTVVASTETKVPEGKMIVDAKPVIVVHALFPQPDKSLKDQMVDEVMKEIIQETVDCGCNSILGMTVTIKNQKQTHGGGYLVKACGTPCLLMPAQVMAPFSTGTTTSNATTGSTSLLLRQRTLSIDDAQPIVRRH